MYRNSYQRGMLTVFFSVGSKPLAIWETHIQDGVITRFLDQDLKSMVLEIRGTNISTTYITCPKGNVVLGITMPFLVMIVKNLKKYFSFEVTILDETGTRRRFRASNFQSNTQILPLCTVMPIALSDGWNQIQFNLAEFTRRAYKKQFVEAQKLKVNANICLRRIYFCERLLADDQLPPEYKLFFPLSSKPGKGMDKKGMEEKAQKDIKPIPTLAEEIMEPKLEVIKGSKASIHSAKAIPGSKAVSKVGIAPGVKVRSAKSMHEPASIPGEQKDEDALEKKPSTTTDVGQEGEGEVGENEELKKASAEAIEKEDVNAEAEAEAEAEVPEKGEEINEELKQPSTEATDKGEEVAEAQKDEA